MKVDKRKILSNLKKDLKAAEIIKLQWDGQRDEWVRESRGEPYGNEVDGKSKIVSKDIRKQLEWLIPSITDPFLSGNDIIKCNPVTYEDVEAAKQNELLLNTQFCRKFPRYNFINKATRVLATEGTLVIQTGWDYEDVDVDEEVEVVKIDEFGIQYIAMEMQTVTKVVKNQPTAVVCRNEDVYLDPTCMDDMDKCQFVIHRYETDLSTLKADGRYKNLDKVAQMATRDDTTFIPKDETRFNFEDQARKKMVVYEYWGNYDVDEDGYAEPIVCAWIGDVIIRLEDNPYPDQKPPFIIVPFNAVPFQMYGEALAENIGDNQKVKTAITRGIIDNMARSNNAQIGIRRNALDMANRKKFLQGKNFEFNGSPQDFWQGSYNQIPGSVFDMLNLQNNEIEAQTGVKSFSGGINGNTLGQMLDIRTNIPMADGTSKQLKDIVDGDVIVGSDGKGTTVTKAHDIKFPERAYDMVFSNGDTIKAGGEHLWTIRVQGHERALRNWVTVDTDTVYSYVEKGYTVYIPKLTRVDNVGTTLSTDIDPYCLGAWLGDGNSYGSRIASEDAEIVEQFAKAGYTLKKEQNQKAGNAIQYEIVAGGSATMFGKDSPVTPFHTLLRRLNVLTRYGGQKHIPEEYFTAPYEVKMELLRGLMDTDGYYHSGSGAVFCQTEGRLKDDVIRLLESMAIKPSVRMRTAEELNTQKAKNPNTLQITSQKAQYEIYFVADSNPFKLARKACRWKPSDKNGSVRLQKMVPTAKVLMRCLTVDSEDSLYACGNNWTLTHNTATAARGAMDATAMRRLHLVRNMAENLMKPLMRKWMAYNSEFLEEEEVVRVTNESYVPVRRDDLQGNIDIDITISTQEDNSARAQELGFLLQTLGNTVPFELTQMVLAEIVGLSRMPDLEKRLREFKPQADPAQEQLKQLELQRMQLEIQKLASEIERNKARAGEDQIDVVLKQQKAAVEAAKARKLGSEADGLDLAFLKSNEGIGDANPMVDMQREEEADRRRMQGEQMKHAQNVDMQMLKHRMDMDKQEHKRLSDLDREALKQMGQRYVLDNKKTN